MSTDHNYCLILAGGVGSRLWPVSRVSKPKQFLDLFGVGRTLLQQTYDRFARFIAPDHIYVSTNVDYLPLVYEQLPEVNDAHILEEPLRRGTLAAVAWGTAVICNADPEARVISSPADQLIMGENEFQEDVLHALDYSGREHCVVSLGVHPTRPETEYGYIQLGDDVIEGDFYHVKSFTEKPELPFAEMFLNDGGFLWNTGLFTFSVGTMLDALSNLVPEYQLELPKIMADAGISDPKFLPEVFRVLPNLSFDLGVLERTKGALVHECHFTWADLGTWATLRIGADHNENVLMGTKALMHNCQGNVVRLSDGRFAIIEGLTDYVVAEEGDVLLICPKKRASVRMMMNNSQLQLGIE